MQNYKTEFIQYCLDQGALKFGQFTLKSGRISPYFFNAGELMKNSAGLAKLGDYYADCIEENKLSFDIVFGPAYKGIPLAAITAATLYNKYQQQKGFTYNRKEAKNHGEGGQFVGDTDLANKKILILDDVITAGTAIAQSMQLLKPVKAVLSSVVVMLDRQEKGQGETSAIQDITEQYQIPVITIINLDDILSFLQSHDEFKQHIDAIEKYRHQYGV